MSINLALWKIDLSNELDILFDEIMSLADRLLLVLNDILLKKPEWCKIITQHIIKWIKNLLTQKSSSASVTRVSVLSRCDSNDIYCRNSSPLHFIILLLT